jgi:hypothetical protein
MKLGTILCTFNRTDERPELSSLLALSKLYNRLLIYPLSGESLQTLLNLFHGKENEH